MMITNNPLNEESLVQLKKRARRRLVGAIVLVFFALILLWNVLDSVPPPSLVKPERIKITNEVPLVSSSSPVQAPVLNEEEVANTVFVESSVPAASRVEQLPTEEVLPTASSPSLPGSLISAPSTQLDKVITEKKSLPPKKVEKTTKLIVKEKNVSKDPMRILEGLDDPSASFKNASPAKSAVPTRTKYLLQVAAYKDAKKAEAVIQHLKMIGVRVSSEKVHSSKGELTRIRVGPYAAREDAEAALKKIRAHDINATLVVK